MLDRITVRGARQHNLKNVHVEIPRNSLTVVTGLSGSGKSSLAFDTIYAEGQRRYVETLSPYARQFLDQMERPDVDSIDGLSPALSIEQRTTSRSPRSTVGTITEIYDYLRLLYSSIGIPHCPNCAVPISRQSNEQIVSRVLEQQLGKKVMILAPIHPGTQGGSTARNSKTCRARASSRSASTGRLYSLDEHIELDRRRSHTIEVVVDRLSVRKGLGKRLENSIKTATRLAGGLVTVLEEGAGERLYSEKLACTECGTSVPAFEPRSFSFNSPYGACEACSGLGSRWEFDPAKVIADTSKPLVDGGIAQGLLAPRVERSLTAGAKSARIPLDKTFDQLSAQQQKRLLYGEQRSNGARNSRPFSGLLQVLEGWQGNLRDRHLPLLDDGLHVAKSVPRLRRAAASSRKLGREAGGPVDLRIRRTVDHPGRGHDGPPRTLGTPATGRRPHRR